MPKDFFKSPMKFSQSVPIKLQAIALSAVVALGIVALGIALRLRVANRATANAQPELSTPKKSQTTPLNATAAHSAQKESLTIASADSSQTKPDKTQPNKEAQLSAISITPIPPAVVNAAAAATGSSSAFNHLLYKEADPARLQPAGKFVRDDFERTESLDFEAANAFMIMVNEAKAQGINLMPISGFRSVAEQQALFTQQTARYGSEAAAAKLSAPPEHSEHHTGYAIDIGDGDRPDTDLAPQFADTAAYQWLLNNAYIFGFEQSFPQNNAQGLNFEPWHWRYVQSERAMQVFAAAKATQTPQP